MRALILFLLAAAAVAAEPPIQAVDHIRVPVADGARQVECLVFYPDVVAPTALVVFSHDLGRSRGAYWYLGEAWSRAGLVAVFPTHARSDRAMVEQVGMFAVLDAVRGAAKDPLVWAERAADLAAVAGGTAAIEAQVPALRGRLGQVPVGMAGHAFGALSAAVAAGLPSQRDAAVPGVRGTVLLGPPGPCAMVGQEAWDALTLPALVAVPGRDAELAAVCGVADDAAWLAAAGCGRGAGSWLLTLPSAHHFTFSNGGWGPRVDPAHVQAIAQASAAFWRRVLLGDALADPAAVAPGADAVITPAGGRDQALSTR